MKALLCCLAALRYCTGALHAEDLPSTQLLTVKRVYVDRLTGGETAAQMRDLIITALHNSKLFVITENADRADAFLRGAAEDLIYTDTFSSSDNLSMHGSARDSNRNSDSSRVGSTSSGVSNADSHGFSLGVGESESTNIHERKHEALATVRLVNKDGDVLWSTTQESKGAKFRGASADVADRITKALAAEYDRLQHPQAARPPPPHD